MRSIPLTTPSRSSYLRERSNVGIHIYSSLPLEKDLHHCFGLQTCLLVVQLRIARFITMYSIETFFVHSHRIKIWGAGAADLYRAQENYQVPLHTPKSAFRSSCRTMLLPRVVASAHKPQSLRRFFFRGVPSRQNARLPRYEPRMTAMRDENHRIRFACWCRRV